MVIESLPIMKCRVKSFPCIEINSKVNMINCFKNFVFHSAKMKERVGSTDCFGKCVYENFLEGVYTVAISAISSYKPVALS